jgi:hypothetical protein
MKDDKARDVSEYQWQFPGGPHKRPRVVSLTDMTREELQEALASSMDHIDFIQRKLGDASDSIERWMEGRPVAEDDVVDENDD